MITAFDEYIHWLNQDARRNHKHILMAKMAKEKETQQLINAFQNGMAVAKMQQENEQIQSNSELPSMDLPNV